MDKLEEHFKTKVEITQKCLEFVKGDPEETMSETNSAMIELGELKHKMEVLRNVVDKLRFQTTQAQKIAEYMHESIENCSVIGENLPKRLGTGGVQDEPAQNVKNGKKPNSKIEPNKQSKSTDKLPVTIPLQSIPKIRYLTYDEFENIPKVCMYIKKITQFCDLKYC